MSWDLNAKKGPGIKYLWNIIPHRGTARALVLKCVFLGRGRWPKEKGPRTPLHRLWGSPLQSQDSEHPGLHRLFPHDCSECSSVTPCPPAPYAACRSLHWYPLRTSFPAHRPSSLLWCHPKLTLAPGEPQAPESFMNHELEPRALKAFMKFFPSCFPVTFERSFCCPSTCNNLFLLVNQHLNEKTEGLSLFLIIYAQYF